MLPEARGGKNDESVACCTSYVGIDDKLSLDHLEYAMAMVVPGQLHENRALD